MKVVFDKKAMLALAILVVSAFILALKILQPSSINIYFERGENSTLISRIPGFYTQTDMIIASISSIILGASGTLIYLLSRSASPAPLAPHGETIWKLLLKERRKKWKAISKILKDDEKKIYEVILEADGIINQSELPEKTGLSKTSVSRALDLLESKGLVERKRRGMGNVVVLR